LEFLVGLDGPFGLEERLIDGKLRDGLAELFGEVVDVVRVLGLGTGFDAHYPRFVLRA
jgi:hypothetical protein